MFFHDRDNPHASILNSLLSYLLLPFNIYITPYCYNSFFVKTQLVRSFGHRIILWNFTKFLISKDGETIRRYAPTTEPKDFEKDIECSVASTHIAVDGFSVHI